MLLGKEHSLEDYIVQRIGTGPILITDLIDECLQKELVSTKQAVYAAVRRLSAALVVVRHNQRLSLHSDWLTKLNRFSLIAQYHYYDEQQGAGQFANMEDGERIQFQFNSSASADIFWAHALQVLNMIVPSAEPFYGYDPHCWFFLVHHEQESALRDNFNAKGRQYLISVDAADYLDKHIRSEFDNEMSQYYISPKSLFDKRSYYVNVLGDFLVEAYFDEQIAQRIDELYKEEDTFDQIVEQKLRAIVQDRGKTRLVVSRNQKKAERIRKKLSKFFYVK